MRLWLARLSLLSAGVLIAPACGEVSGTPGPFTLTLPANLDVAVPVTGATFEWTASPTASSYRFELSDTPTFGSILLAVDDLTTTTFSPAFGLTHSTSYYWRVEARSALGTIVASDAPFLFTTVAAGPGLPGSFTLSAPADGATGISETPTFSWTASANAISYTLEVATDAAFTSVVGSQSGILFTFAPSPVTLATNTLYFWRATAANGAGSTQASGAPDSFTTAAGAPLPGSFTLSGPPDGATGVSRMPTFSWTSSVNAVSYTLEIATDAAFTAVIGTRTGIVTTSTSTPVTLNASTPYFWRVTAVNGAGSTPAAGSPFSFTTTGLSFPASFTLLSPSDGSTGVPLVPTFSWNPSSIVISYTLEIAGDAGFTVMIATRAGIVTTSALSPVILSENTIYHWRVKAVNGAGHTVATGAPRSFTTALAGALPGAFTQTTPPNGATGIARAPTFTWTSSSSALNYGLEIASDAGFATIVGRVTGGPGTSLTSPIVLASATTYYWRVFSATVGSVRPATGAPFSFTTVGSSPGSPDPALGSDGIVIDGVDLDEANAVVVLSDGRIVVGGGAADGVWNGSNADFVLARYQADGALDPSFGTGGKVRTKVAGYSDNILGMALQADGKIVAAGISYDLANTRILLARYDAGGALDPAFGSGGLVVTLLPGAVSCFAREVVIQPDQKILICGQTAGTNFLLARYNTDGSLDGTFGTGGISHLPFAAGGSEYGHSLALQSDGKIVAVGRGRPTSGSSYVVIVARYTTAGALDTTFNSTGYVYSNAIVGNDAGMSPTLALQSDERIVVAGWSEPGRTVTLLRFLTDGTPDSTFDGDGILQDTALGGEANALVIQSDGKFVVAGFSGQLWPNPGNAMVARYTSSGARDTSFNGDGVLHLPLSGSNNELRALALTPGGTIVAVGLAGNGTRNEQVVIRIVP